MKKFYRLWHGGSYHRDPAMMSKVDKALRIEFCRDLCNELVIKGDYPPVYPPWAKELALHMTRLGWTKPSPEVTIEPANGEPETTNKTPADA